MTHHMGEAMSGLPTVTGFGHQLSTEQTNALLSAFARTLLDRLSPSGWSAGLDLVASLTSNDLHNLCSDSPDTLDLSPADQSIIRQCRAFFSKRSDLDLGVDRKGAAKRKFDDAERACAVTNACFRAWAQGRFQFRPCVEGVLHTAQRKIAEVLGTCPSYMDIRPRFGPGATTATHKKNACVATKLQAGVQCSTNFPDGELQRYISWEHNPSVREQGDSVEVGIHLSRISFVAKNAKTDRAIMVEPMLNGMYQAGLGDVMARRLKRVGIDLKDQSANQRAALYGSISNVSATLDLSSASDTVAWKLVEHLLPSDWFTMIFDLSTREGVVDGQMTVLEKISSMGNGITFPLETLIFWSLSQAAKDIVCPNHRTRVLVYGDDIIVPVPCVPLLRTVLHDLGFSLNWDKSFWDGGFRESCGCDYVLGENVRPVYVKGALNGADVFVLHNFFLRAGRLDDARFWENVVDPSIRIYGPDGYGDGHLVRTDYQKYLRPRGDGAFTFQSFSLQPKKLARRIASTMAERVKATRPMWDPKTKGFTRKQTVHFRLWLPEAEVLVRTLATYTQMARESRVLTLTESDKMRSKGGHVYADRRMPDPQTRDDEDFFVVPGTGAVRRTNIYIFESGVCS